MISIYKLTSPSGKVYIGKASNLSMRWKKHKENAERGTISKLYAAIRKYG